MACGVRLKGPTGTWGAGRGRQDSERRDEKWRPAGVDTCTGGQAIHYRKRGDSRVHRVEQLSLRMVERGE